MTHLAVELAHGALRAGETVTGLVTLETARLRRLTRLRVEAVGLELLGVGSRYQQIVYQHPVPRPWGRTRSGARRIDFRVVSTLVQQPLELEPGRHCWAFAIAVPAEALPTYGGASVVCEHEVNAAAEFADGPPVRAWAPLHLWAAAAEPPPHQPLLLQAPDPSARGLLPALAAGLSGSLGLRVSGPSRVLGLGEPTRLQYAVDNPSGRPLNWLRIALEAVETTRLRAATDVGRFVADVREIRLPRGSEVRGTTDWQVPANLAPSLRAKRFSVRWELRASVSGPWTPGVSGRVELELFDPASVPAGPAKEGGAA